MYPNLYYAIKDWFGIEINALKIFYTFGIFVAISFIICAVLLSKELKRKEKQGKLHPQEEEITVGQPASVTELLINGLIGFVFGYKILGAFIASRTANIDLQDYVFSSEGNVIGGLLLGGILVYLKFREKNKLKLAKPERRMLRIWPHDRVGDIVIIALVAGILGAKLFDNLENWDRFIKDPIGNLVSPSGLTFYGGLIVASIVICLYMAKKGVNTWHLVDAAAPVLMLAYALGRIGCQVSGDGDWGVFNSAYISDQPGHVVLASPGDYERKLNENATYFLSGKVTNPDSTVSIVTDRIYPALDKVPHKSFKAPSFLPDWMFAYTFPHNVNEDGIPMKDCTGKYCRALPQPVFPTSFYEMITCFLLFLVLWFLRKHIHKAGMLFSIYLILNGLERFAIEKIRVNSEYAILGLHPSQAELISFGLILSGIILLIYTSRRPKSHHLG
jgi:phosphatidylglycerol---prolipoprotein diacylglyceryl transferase